MPNPEQFPEIKIHKKTLEKLSPKKDELVDSVDLNKIDKNDILILYTEDGSAYRFEEIKKPANQEKEYPKAHLTVKGIKEHLDYGNDVEIMGCLYETRYQKDKISKGSNLVFAYKIKKGNQRVIKTPPIINIEKISQEA